MTAKRDKSGLTLKFSKAELPALKQVMQYAEAKIISAMEDEIVYNTLQVLSNVKSSDDYTNSDFLGGD